VSISEKPTKVDAIRGYIRNAHAQSEIAPVVYPDQNGAFPGSFFNGLLRGESLLVVPDTNVLLGDIGRAFRTGRRTVLISAANSGALRLFCAQHVHEEIIDHSEEWAPRYGATRSAYLDLWDKEYLPQMRTVEASDVPADFLTPLERARVDALGASLDVPSVILSLALGAFYLTKDRPARRAVYGVDAAAEELDTWLLAIMDGGEANEREKMVVAALTVPALAIGGAVYLVGSLGKVSPWIYVPIGGLAALLLSRTSSDTYRKIGDGLREAGSLFLEVYRPYSEALDRFRQMAPAIPTWEEQADVNDRRLVLARACLHKLARAPRSMMTAKELADELRELPVGRNAQLVRESLRRFGCFVEPYRGRWQVGHTVHLRYD
jgi:hypothetical protein